MRIVARSYYCGTSGSSTSAAGATPTRASAPSSISTAAPSISLSAPSVASSPSAADAAAASSPTDQIRQRQGQEWYYITPILKLEDDVI